MNLPENRLDAQRIPALPHAGRRRLGTFWTTALIIAALFTVLGAKARAEDPLARLLPPDAAVLAGMHRAIDVPTDQLWLATPNNIHDLNEFVSATATDSDRRFDELIVADAPAGSDMLGDHLLLARGYFRFAVLRSAPGMLVSRFEDVPVLVIPADKWSGPRWLAVLHDRIALSGSPSAVGRAIERDRTSAPADPAILARLHQAASGEVSWSSVTLDPAVLHNHLRLHPSEVSIAPCLEGARTITLGSTFRPEARIKLRILTGSASQAAAASSCFAGLVHRASQVEVRVASAPATATLAVTFSGSRDAYTRWLANYRQPIVDDLLAAARPPASRLETSTGQ